VDETCIRLWDLPLYHWRLPKSYPQAIQSTRKNLGKVNVWGGFSFRGATDFAVIIIIINFWNKINS
jgi:hypothetical protein